MPAFSKSALSDAITAVGKMDNRQRELLTDDIHAHQPQLLASVLFQQRHGATLEQIEVLLNLLLVSYLAMKGSGHAWPLVTEAIQESCFARLAGRMRFLEGISNEGHSMAVSDVVATHGEPWLLAFVFDELQSHGLLGIDTDAKKFLVLCALGMVECIAEAASLSA